MELRKTLKGSIQSFKHFLLNVIIGRQKNSTVISDLCIHITVILQKLLISFAYIL